MQDMAAVALLTGLLLAGGTVAWYWIYDKYTASRRSINACCCGMYDLTSIQSQRTKYYVHERLRCFPLREWVKS
ncbi:MAG: hypothetical protein IPK64_20505 [bacterium]|nr:hypothetical protein [bacterium]